MEEYLHSKIIKVPIYPGRLQCILTNSPDMLDKIIPDHGKNVHSLYGSTYCYSKNGQRRYAVVLNVHNLHRKVSFGVLAHESHHASNWILQHIGHDADFENDEPSTYLTQFVMNFITSFLRKNKLLKEIV